ncbi:MAG: DUF3352 domain-containing protein [Archangium sp.]
MTSSRAWVLAALAAFSFSCSKCGGSGGGTSSATAGVERVIPKGAVGAVIVPSLDQAGQKLGLIQNLKVTSFVGQLQGFESGQQFGDALVAQLGLDLRSHEALERAGVDGARSAGAAMLITGYPYLALPVKDEAKFHATLEKLAQQRLGTTLSREVKTEGSTVVTKTFLVKEGDVPSVGYVLSNGYALVSNEGGVAKLAALATMTENDSLATDRGYVAELEKLPKERDVVVYLPLGSPALVQAPLASAVASVTLTSEALTVMVSAAPKPNAMDLQALTPQPGGKDLLGYLPRDAFVVARYQGDPAKLGPWAKTLMGPYLRKAFEEAGFDVETQALSQVKPGVVAALSLSDAPPMDRGMPEFNLRETNPFTYAHLSGAAAAKDPASILPALEKVATIAPKFGANMELRTRADGQKAMVTTYSAGEGVHFAPKDELVFFASPIQRLDGLVKSDGKGGSPVSALGDEALAVAIDLSRLSASVRALPESAWGLGGFAIKATTVRWLDATDDLKGISISVGVKDERVQAKVRLALGGAPAGAGTK